MLSLSANNACNRAEIPESAASLAAKFSSLCLEPVLNLTSVLVAYLRFLLRHRLSFPSSLSTDNATIPSNLRFSSGFPSPYLRRIVNKEIRANTAEV